MDVSEPAADWLVSARTTLASSSTLPTSKLSRVGGSSNYPNVGVSQNEEPHLIPKIFLKCFILARYQSISGYLILKHVSFLWACGEKSFPNPPLPTLSLPHTTSTLILTPYFANLELQPFEPYCNKHSTQTQTKHTQNNTITLWCLMAFGFALDWITQLQWQWILGCDI